MTPSLVYIDHLQRANSGDLAFYPATAIRKALAEGRILGAEENGEPAGYLWHGPLRPGRDVFIYQAAIDYSLRRRHLGFALVADLLGIAAAGHATGIRLRCASSSESNEFWRALGFYCTAVVPGGPSRGRDLNLWRADIHPGFFRLEVPPSERPADRAAYHRAWRRGDAMASRWGRGHYG